MSVINILQLKTTRNTPVVGLNAHCSDGESMPGGTMVAQQEGVRSYRTWTLIK